MIMKKLSLLLCVFAFAQAVSAQTKFFFMPEIGMGTTSIKIGTADGLKYTKERKTYYFAQSRFAYNPRL